MIDNALEKMVTRGLVTYIASIHYNSEKKIVEVCFLKDPEESVINRRLTFLDVEDYSEEIFEPFDENFIDSLIGLDTYGESHGKKYVIQTEVRVWIFHSNAEPQFQSL